jgi:hypothetical protein
MFIIRSTAKTGRIQIMVKSYLSPSNTYSFEYPDDWKIEKDAGTTIVLFKKGGLFKKDSSNLLRITPYLSDSIISPEAYKALINKRKQDHKDLLVIEKSDKFIMNFNILKYTTETYQNLGDTRLSFISYYWELLISNRIFTCWFTVNKEEADLPKTKEEMAIAEKILYSLKLL